MLQSNTQLLDTLFNGQWEVKAKKTAQILDTFKLSSYTIEQETKNGHTFYDVYKFVINENSDIHVSATFVKSKGIWKVSHYQEGKVKF